MRFDAFKWNPLTLGTDRVSQGGKIEVRASVPVTLFVRTYGVEAIVDTGHIVKADVEPGSEYWIEGPKTAKAYHFDPAPRTVGRSEEVFTNFDTIPAPSASEAAIQQLLRRFKLEQKAELKKMREQTKAAGHTVKEDPERPAESEVTEEAEPTSDPEPAPRPAE